MVSRSKNTSSRKETPSKKPTKAAQKKLDELEAAATLQHFAAIGHVAAKWSYFEAVIDDWTLRIAKIPVEAGVSLTSQISGSARKLDAFTALVNLSNVKPSLLKDIHKFSELARGLAEQRNRVVHDFWDVSDILDPRRVEATARKKLRLESIPVSTAEVLNLAIQIEEMAENFDNLASRVLTEPRTSSSK
jgi:hypothetical protein